MIKHDVIIIGGGASGLLSSIVAKDNGADVAIIEGENRVAKKLLITGNGRCNFTNYSIEPPFVNFHSSNNNFYNYVLNELTVNDTVDLFYTYGLPLITLENNKMYPKSLQASSVVDILRLNIEERDIPIYLESKVINIERKGSQFIIETNNEENKFFLANRVLISCGGFAAPNTGSDGSIINIIKKLGHKVINPLPSIVQLKLDYKNLKAISGVRFDALASIYVNNKLISKDFDEVLFTDYGISGPAILQVSRSASIALDKKEDVKVVLDLFPDKTVDEIKEFFEAHFSIFNYRSVYNSLIGIINKKLLPIVLKESKILDIHKTCDSLEYFEKANLYKLLKKWDFNCIGTNGLKNAQTTIGGIDTKDIDDKTLESKIIPGLYFSGEVLDVDGDCGGYNLQWAWSSGYVAGMNISKK